MRQIILSKLFGFTPKSLYNWKTEEKQYNDYNNPDNDPRGAWVAIPLLKFSSTDRPSLKYSVISPLGEEIIPKINQNWTNSKETVLNLIKNKQVWFGGKEQNIPYKKRYLVDDRDKNPKKGRPIIALIEKYLSEEDISEFLRDKKISWLDNLKNNDSKTEKLLMNIEKRLELYPAENCLNALLLISSLKNNHKFFKLKDPEIMSLDDYIHYQILLDNTIQRLLGVNISSSNIYFIQSIIIELYDNATLLFVVDQVDRFIIKFKSLHKLKSVNCENE